MKAKTLSNFVKIGLVVFILIVVVGKLLIAKQFLTLEEAKALALIVAIIFALFAPIDLSVMLKSYLEKKAGINEKVIEDNKK